MDVNGNCVDVNGNRVDVKGNRADVKGNHADVKGKRVDVKGNRLDVKGNRVDVKGNHVDVKGNHVDVKGNLKPLRPLWTGPGYQTSGRKRHKDFRNHDSSQIDRDGGGSGGGACDRIRLFTANPPPTEICILFRRTLSRTGLGLVQGTSTLHTELAPGNPGCSQRR